MENIGFKTGGSKKESKKKKIIESSNSKDNGEIKQFLKELNKQEKLIIKLGKIKQLNREMIIMNASDSTPAISMKIIKDIEAISEAIGALSAIKYNNQILKYEKK